MLINVNISESNCAFVQF